MRWTPRANHAISPGKFPRRARRAAGTRLDEPVSGAYRRPRGRVIGAASSLIMGGFGRQAGRFFSPAVPGNRTFGGTAGIPGIGAGGGPDPPSGPGARER